MTPQDSSDDARLLSPEAAVDDLLMTLEQGDHSPTELRLLLFLADGDATPAELAAALDRPPAEIGSASRRLAMRGLARRRFQRGRQSRFIMGITDAGLGVVRPLVQRLVGRSFGSRNGPWRRDPEPRG
jgi:DNA-binding MarR family transcriptional regulator